MGVVVVEATFLAGAGATWVKGRTLVVSIGGGNGDGLCEGGGVRGVGVVVDVQLIATLTPLRLDLPPPPPFQVG